MLTAISRPAKTPEEALDLFTSALHAGFVGVQAKSGQYDAAGPEPDSFFDFYKDTAHLVKAGFVVYPGGDADLWKEKVIPLALFAKEINAEHICMCTPVKPWDKPDNQYKEIAITLNSIGQTVIEHNVSISLHNHAGTLFETEDDLNRLCEFLDPLLCGLTFDTAHAAKGNITDLPGFVSHFKDFITNVHLKDMDSEGSFCPPGKGTLDLTGIIKALEDISYNRWLVIDEETKGMGHAEACGIAIEFLHNSLTE